jgi:hypothetical protein
MTLADLELDLASEAFGRAMDAIEDERRAKMTASQLRDYRIFQGEIAARCPNCGKRDVEIEHKSEPDMIGECVWVHYECCGHDGDSRNTHCEYDAHGRVVDVG